MTDPSSPEKWAEHYDVAIRYVNSLDDPQRKQFVMCLVTIVTVRMTQGERPSAPLDMLYLAQSASLLFDQRAELLRVLSGEDLRWWPET